MNDAGRVLMLAGGVLLLLGAALSLSGKLPWLGRLPGDLVYRRGNLTLYFPIATSLLLSVVLTLLVRLLRR
jgi:membrane protein implicated in regulation of membrane protease activity